MDLVTLVSRHVELKKAGRTYKGRCPFHEEKTPSFNVNPEMKRYKCFGCQAGGDAISFVQRYMGKSFVDSVRDLAREVGVDLESAEDPTLRERQQIKEATDAASEHFRAMLWDAKAGELPRKYLLERGVTEESARVFGLGWAPAEWDLLAKRLLTLGILEFGHKAGLVAPRKTAEGFYDMFRGRLIVPIRSPEGRTIAFGGRLLVGDEGPKYLNSRESRLYNKSETLYGADQAREDLRRVKTAVLVEGYFDCIGLHQVGLKNTVALCSTALTPGHLTLLKRLEARDVVLLLDGDDAGLKAVERLAASLLATGTPTKVALLPAGDDPDTFARREGLDGVQRLIASAEPLSRHLFLTALPAGANASFEEKMEALARLKPTVEALPLGLFRSAFISALSQYSGLPAQELEVTLRGRPAPLTHPIPKLGPLQGPPAAPLPPPEKSPDLLESVYVAALLREPRLFAKDVRRVGDELKHTGLRNAVGRIASGLQTADVLDEASDLTRRGLESAVRQMPAEGPELEEAFTQVCRKLKLRRIDEQLSYIARVTGLTPGASELTEETKKLQEERVELLALRRRVLEEAIPLAVGTKRPAKTV